MIYKFKSAASGDLIMLGPQGDQMLRLIGREPVAQGIIEPGAMPAVMAALQAAIAADKPPADADPADAGADETASAGLGLRQRLWPLIEMLRRSHAAQEPVVWGV